MKRLYRKSIILLTLVIMMVFIPFPVNPGTEINTTLDLLNSRTVYAAEKNDVIYIKKVTANNVRKIHNALNKEKAFDLKVLGNKSQSLKKVTKINNKLKAYNKQGVIFLYDDVIEGKKYTTYRITQRNAEDYKYAILLVEKLYNTAKVEAADEMEYVQDYLTTEEIDKANYPDDMLRFKRQIYDSLMDVNQCNYPTLYFKWQRMTNTDKFLLLYLYHDLRDKIEELMIQKVNADIWGSEMETPITFEEFISNQEIDKIIREDLFPNDAIYIEEYITPGATSGPFLFK